MALVEYWHVVWFGWCGAFNHSRVIEVASAGSSWLRIF